MAGYAYKRKYHETQEHDDTEHYNFGLQNSSECDMLMT